MLRICTSNPACIFMVQSLTLHTQRHGLLDLTSVILPIFTTCNPAVFPMFMQVYHSNLCMHSRKDIVSGWQWRLQTPHSHCQVVGTSYMAACWQSDSAFWYNTICSISTWLSECSQYAVREICESLCCSAWKCCTELHISSKGIPVQTASYG